MGFFDKVKSAFQSDANQEEPDASADPFTAPESAVEDRVSVSKRTEIIIEHYDGVTGREAKQIAQTLKKHLEEPEGYSARDMINEIDSAVDLDEELIETIVLTENASISNMNTIEDYMEREADDWVYKITVSDDGHPICTDARDKIESKGGVSLEELARILIENAEEHEEGTPKRMDHWVPHERCKHRVVRHVD
jgi:hypothetical protein